MDFFSSGFDSMQSIKLRNQCIRIRFHMLLSVGLAEQVPQSTCVVYVGDTCAHGDAES